VPQAAGRESALIGMRDEKHCSRACCQVAWRSYPVVVLCLRAPARSFRASGKGLARGGPCPDGDGPRWGTTPGNEREPTALPG